MLNLAESSVFPPPKLRHQRRPNLKS